MSFSPFYYRKFFLFVDIFSMERIEDKNECNFSEVMLLY